MAEAAEVSPPHPLMCGAEDMLVEQQPPPPPCRLDARRRRGVDWEGLGGLQGSLGGGMVGRGSIVLHPAETHQLCSDVRWLDCFICSTIHLSPIAYMTGGDGVFIMGVVGRCADGDTAMVGLFDRSIDRIQPVESACCSYIS
jgi:hypothetical protein